MDSYSALLIVVLLCVFAVYVALITKGTSGRGKKATRLVAHTLMVPAIVVIPYALMSYLGHVYCESVNPSCLLRSVGLGPSMYGLALLVWWFVLPLSVLTTSISILLYALSGRSTRTDIR